MGRHVYCVPFAKCTPSQFITWACSEKWWNFFSRKWKWTNPISLTNDFLLSTPEFIFYKKAKPIQLFSSTEHQSLNSRNCYRNTCQPKRSAEVSEVRANVFLTTNTVREVYSNSTTTSTGIESSNDNTIRTKFKRNFQFRSNHMTNDKSESEKVTQLQSNAIDIDLEGNSPQSKFKQNLNM